MKYLQKDEVNTSLNPQNEEMKLMKSTRNVRFTEGNYHEQSDIEHPTNYGNLKKKKNPTIAHLNLDDEKITSKQAHDKYGSLFEGFSKDKHDSSSFKIEGRSSAKLPSFGENLHVNTNISPIISKIQPFAPHETQVKFKEAI
jgi:hypothetical protein